MRSFLGSNIGTDVISSACFSWGTAGTSYTLIIDAGHGGEDGGAVSLTGVAESRINLEIALRLESLFELYGVPVKMVRTEDVSLHAPDASTLREKKRSDLGNRAALVQNTENAVLLSIHQNTYPEPRYRGAQVFFAPTNGSKELAQKLQERLRIGLDPNNGRDARLIPDTVYLMNHVSCPAVLVECGFLTNPEEEQLLRQENYQKKLAVVLVSGILMDTGSINTPLE